MGRIPVSLGQILRRYSFPDTQLRRDVVPYQVHGALRAPPDEADLGPARFWTGVGHRRALRPRRGSCARLETVGCACAHGGQPAPARCLLARGRGGSRLGLQGQLSRRAAAEAALPAAQDRDREPAKPTKKHCNGFMRHGRQDFGVPSHARTAVWCPRRPGTSPGPVPARFFGTCRPRRPHLCLLRDLCTRDLRRPPRHRRDACSTARRCRFLTARWRPIAYLCPVPLRKLPDTLSLPRLLSCIK